MCFRGNPTTRLLQSVDYFHGTTLFMFFDSIPLASMGIFLGHVPILYTLRGKRFAI